MVDALAIEGYCIDLLKSFMDEQTYVTCQGL